MRETRKRRLMLAAALGAIPALSAGAFAQVPVQQGGRAQDANTRVGSGGYNDSIGQSTFVSPNDIAYKNVTGGRGFRGPIAERDPRAFMGPIGGRLNNAFIRDSSAAPLPYQPSADQLSPTPFFGETRGVAPPVGTIREGFSGAYLGTQYTPQNPLEMSSEFTSTLSDVYLQPLGQSVLLGVRSNVLGLQPGELVLQGPLEANNAAAVFTGSPLYGIRQLRAGEQLNDTGNSSLYGQPGASLTGRGIDEATLRQMRAELLMNPGYQQPTQNQLQNQQDQQNSQNQQGGPNQPGANAPNSGQPRGQNLGQPLGQNLGQPLEAPENAANNASVNANSTPGAFTSGTNTYQGIQQRSTLATPAQQMTQYNELQRRMQRYENPQVAAIEQAHEFRLEQLRQAGTPASGTPASQPANAAAALPPNVVQQAAIPQAQQQQPVKPLKIKSLATGVRYPGLRTLMTNAEQQMKEGKFQSAMETYDAAQKVATNNWMIRVGRANAELGGGFYQQASDDLHEAYAYSTPLVLAQYDLNAMLTPQRVQYVTRELKDLAAKNPKDETPVFLLAYVAYNTGDEAQASKYLKEAGQRASNQDPLIKLLQQRWYLPQASSPAGSGAATPGPAELNK